MSTDAGEPAGSRDQAETGYDELLGIAVAALTGAARLRRPVLAKDSTGAWVPGERTEAADWAEFVTLALAGAAANLGGIEVALSGRPGSWEAEGVRQLLTSTVGADETGLWTHRTEPIRVTLYVEEILGEIAPELTAAYDEAGAQLEARWEETSEANEVDADAYVWTYERDNAGGWTPLDAAAPPFDLEVWRAEAVAAGTSAETLEYLLTEMRDPASHLMHFYIDRSQEDRVELDRLDAVRDAALAPIEALTEALEAQRVDELQVYGQALADRVRTALAALPGLSVPVGVEVDVTTYRPDHERVGPADTGGVATVVDRVVEAAAMDTPTPAELPGTPLERLADATA